MRNSTLQHFLIKYTYRHVPDEPTLRKSDIHGCYNKVINEIKSNVSNNYVLVYGDETTDILGRCVTTILIGILHSTLLYTPYLIKTSITSKVDS